MNKLGHQNSARASRGGPRVRDRSSVSSLVKEIKYSRWWRMGGNWAMLLAGSGSSKGLKNSIASVLSWRERLEWYSPETWDGASREQQLSLRQRENKKKWGRGIRRMREKHCQVIPRFQHKDISWGCDCHTVLRLCASLVLRVSKWESTL